MTDTITLGAKEFPIAPLTLGQMRQVGPCFTRMGIDTPEGMSAQITIIYQGIKAANPETKMEEIDAVTGVTFEQIRKAVEAIGTMAGLEMKKGGATTGEAKPADAPPAE